MVVGDDEPDRRSGLPSTVAARVGHSDNAVIRPRLASHEAVWQKPFTPAVVAQHVREVLDQRPWQNCALDRSFEPAHSQRRGIRNGG